MRPLIEPSKVIEPNKVLGIGYKASPWDSTHGTFLGDVLTASQRCDDHSNDDSDDDDDDNDCDEDDDIDDEVQQYMS